MRFVDANGRIAWKATPNLCQYLRTLNSMPRTILRTSNYARPRTEHHPFFNRSTQSQSCCDCKMSGKQFKPAVIGMRSIDI